jgi:hypothetical protein
MSCIAPTLSHALGGGAEAHWMIAALAKQQLTPAVKAQVQRLLDLETGATLPSVCSNLDR